MSYDQGEMRDECESSTTVVVACWIKYFVIYVISLSLMHTNTPTYFIHEMNSTLWTVVVAIAIMSNEFFGVRKKIRAHIIICLPINFYDENISTTLSTAYGRVRERGSELEGENVRLWLKINFFDESQSHDIKFNFPTADNHLMPQKR